jgi:hypothetical protein
MTTKSARADVTGLGNTGALVSRNWHCQNTSKAASQRQHGRHPVDVGSTDHGPRLWSGGMKTAPTSLYIFDWNAIDN